MEVLQKKRRLYIGLAAVALLAALPQFFWIAQGRDELSIHTLADDAFYYFQTARNVAEGKGSLSSGDIPHNGYHPLWMLLCAFFFKVTPGGDLSAVRAILSCGVVMGALTGFLFGRLLLRQGLHPWVAFFGMALFLFNPFWKGLETSGLESPLFGLLLVLFLQVFLEWRKDAPWKQTLLLGLLTGLLYLTRTDNVFLLGAAYLWLWYREGHRALPRLFAAGCLALAVAAPWHVWNYARFGVFAQGSAAALPRIREIAWYGANPSADVIDFFRYRLGLFWGWFPAIFYFGGAGSPGLLLLAGGLGAAFFPAGRRVFLRQGALWRLVPPLLVAVIALGFVHKFFRLASRDWYFVTSDFLVALLLALAADGLYRFLAGFPSRPVLARRLSLFFAIGCLGLFGLFYGYKGLLNPYAGWIKRQNRAPVFGLTILEHIQKANLPLDTPIGATDSGLIGFYAKRPIINLDGVVNPRAAQAIAEGRLLDYVEKAGIRHLTITPRMRNAQVLGPDFQKRLRPYPPLTAEGFQLVEPEGP